MNEIRQPLGRSLHQVLGEIAELQLAPRVPVLTLLDERQAFFAFMYYAALRPEEAAMLSKQDLQMPETGWGELLLSETAPIAGGSWTDTGERRDRRQLKQRAVGEVRPVQSPRR